jgi:hypothetical protein
MSRQEASLKTLVICDRHDVSWIETAKSENGTSWDLMLLRVSGAWFQRQHGAALASVQGARLLDVASFAPAANRDVSRFMVDTIHWLPSFDVGGRILGEWLQEADGNAWWSLEITEKSSFRGPLVERLFNLALVREALATGTYDRLWIRIADPLLANAIAAASGIATIRHLDAPSRAAHGFVRAYWSRALAAVVRFTAVRILVALTRWTATVPAGGLGIFTLFPYWWIEPFGARPSERFFSAPPAKERAHYAAWITWPGKIWRQRSALRRTLQRTPIVPLQRFVSWRKALGVFSPSRFLRFLRAHRAVNRHLVVHFKDADVSSLIADELTTSMSDAELFFDEILHSAVSGYLTAVRPAALAFRVEGQPWEHAVVSASRRASVPLIGFFHSMFGDNYPALRYAPGEVAGADHGAGPRPLAQRLLVSGSTAEAYLLRDGYHASAVARCGPQRHASFVEFLRTRPSRESLRQRLGLAPDIPVYFVAIAIVEAETEGLFACIEEALAGQSTFQLLIKTHPNRPGGDASMQAAVATLGRERVGFVPAGADMYEYLAASDTMVCIGSTVAFEAMALDVMPIVYEHAATFAATSLRAFEDALYVVNSPAAMRLAVEECASDAPAARARRTRWAATVSGVFGDLQIPLEEQLQRALAQLGVAGYASEVSSNGIR